MADAGPMTPLDVERGLRALFPEVGALPGRLVRVIDSHTAGHPTRVFPDGVEALAGHTVRAQRDDFRARLDHLRGTLLAEPRGQAATFGAVLVPSAIADVGVFFIGTHAYLDMCGHGTIGLARTLRALSRLQGRDGFTMETPAGLVEVALRGGDRFEVTLRNVPSRVLAHAVEVDVAGRRWSVDLAYGGVAYGIVDAAAGGLTIEPDRVGALVALGMRLRAALREAGHGIESVLFFEDLASDRARHLVVLAGGLFDRSPCGTGTSARLALLHAQGRLEVGHPFTAECVTGDRFTAEIVAAADGAVVPEITGRAWLTGFTALVIEPGDPLATGFVHG